MFGNKISYKQTSPKNLLKKLGLGAMLSAATFGGTSCEPTEPELKTRDVYIEFSEQNAVDMFKQTEAGIKYLQAFADSAAKIDVKNVYVKPVGNHENAGQTVWKALTDEIENLNDLNSKIIGSKSDTLKLNIFAISEADEARLTKLNFTLRDFAGRER